MLWNIPGKRFLHALPGLLFLIVVLFVYLHAPDRREPYHMVHSKPADGFARLDHMTFTYSIHGRKVFFLKAEQIKMDKRKIGFFSVSGLKRITIVNVEARYYQPVHPAGTDTESLLLSCFTAAGSQFADHRKTAADMLNIRNIMFWIHSGDAEPVGIHAARLIPDEAANVLIFNKATVHCEREVLSAEKISYDPFQGIIFSDAAYSFTNGSQTIMGKGFRTDTAFGSLKTLLSKRKEGS